MRKLMKYYIVSGSTVEERISYLPIRSSTVKKSRGIRRAGSSSARKISANERQEELRLGRILNANFQQGGYLVTLKYSDSRLPADYEELCKNGEKLMRRLRILCQRAGVPLKRVLVNANWSPKRGAPARLHHHLVINELPLDLLKELWPEGELDIRTLERGKDLTSLAAYLCRNVRAEGKRKWAPSRGLAGPTYSEPEPVENTEAIEIPISAANIHQQPTLDDDGRQVGAYLRCTLPEPPKIVHGRLVIPRPPKRGGHKRC